jgi:hypothetical protein
MRQPVRLTLFSVEEASRVANEIRPELLRLARVRRELAQLERRMDVLSLAVAGASPDNPDVSDLERVVARRDQLGSELRLGIEAVHRRGCLLKDVEKGLVDFYALSGDRLIFLCWHVGETEVAHWHPLEGGFANRQPLKTSERE